MPDPPARPARPVVNAAIQEAGWGVMITKICIAAPLRDRITQKASRNMALASSVASVVPPHIGTMPLSAVTR